LKFKLFKNKIEPSCSYCKFGRADSSEKVFCQKKGIKSLDESCKSFKYDPLKRVPNKIILNSEYSKKDFEI